MVLERLRHADVIYTEGGNHYYQKAALIAVYRSMVGQS
jgi:hypothetical protein